MNPAFAVEELSEKHIGTTPLVEAELQIQRGTKIDHTLAIATFGSLLHRYTGLTTLEFDLILDPALDTGGPRVRVRVDISETSTWASLKAVIDPVPHRVSVVACLIPQDLARFFQMERTTAACEHLIAVIFSGHESVTRVTLRFAGGIYDIRLIGGLAKHMERLLESTSNAADLLISEIPMMSPSELRHLLVDMNGPTIEFDRLTIPDAFEAQVHKTPDANAIKFNNIAITYRELHTRASEAACLLQQEGVGIESLVGVYLDDPVAIAIAYFGIVMAGGALVPLDPEWPKDRLHQVIGVGLNNIVTTDRLRLDLPEGAHTVLYRTFHKNSIGSEFVKPALTPDSAAYVVHTSGSTGVPKGVVGLHRTITSASVAAIPMEKEEVYALSASLTFGAGVVGLFHPLVQGGAVLLVGPQLAKDLPRLVDTWTRASATRIVMVPPQLRELCLLKGIKERLKKVRIIILAGAALNADILPEVYDLFPQAVVTNGYTCLEIGTMTTRWESWPFRRRLSLTVGTPLPNIQVYILGANGSPLPIGMPGEIYVGSADLSRGYLNQPELTRERFLPNPFQTSGIPRVYRTGDMGRLLPNGELEWLGRFDNQVKVRGIRVELEEIELALQAHPNVQHAAVIAIPHENDSRLIAFVAPKVGRSVLVSALRDHLAATLPAFCIPPSLIIADKLPLTGNGKVDRENLPKIGLARPEIDTPFLSPRNLTEQNIKAVWEQELGFEGIGVNDHFLEIGGDSLLAVRISVGIEERLGVALPVASLFEFPTIAQLAEQLILCSARIGFDESGS